MVCFLHSELYKLLVSISKCFLTCLFLNLNADSLRGLHINTIKAFFNKVSKLQLYHYSGPYFT